MGIKVVWVVVALGAVGCATEVAPSGAALDTPPGFGNAPAAGSNVEVVQDLGELAGLSAFAVPVFDPGTNLGGIENADCYIDAESGDLICDSSSDDSP